MAAPIQIFRKNLGTGQETLKAGYSGISMAMAIKFMDNFAKDEAHYSGSLTVREASEPDPENPDRTIYRRMLNCEKDGDVVLYYIKVNPAVLPPAIDSVTSADQAKQLAIDYQAMEDLSYSEVADWGNFFAQLGEKFGLTEEFKENAII